MIYNKSYVQSKAQTDRSVASDGLIDIYKRRVALNIYRKGANKFGRKIGFKIENERENQNQSSPKLIGISTVLRCIFGPNVVILAWTADEWWCEQAQNEVKFDFQVKFDLADQIRSSPKNNRDPNQGVLHLWSKFGDLSLNGRWIIMQTSSWLIHTHTHGHTDPQTQAMTIPEGQNWPRVKIIISEIRTICHFLWLGHETVVCTVCFSCSYPAFSLSIFNHCFIISLF